MAGGRSQGTWSKPTQIQGEPANSRKGQSHRRNVDVVLPGRLASCVDFTAVKTSVVWRAKFVGFIVKAFPKALNHALPSKKKNNHNNFFDVCQAKEKVCDIKETLCRSAASQYNCGPARLVLINGSPSPELVSRWPTPPAASNYSSSISPPQLCLWISIVQKMCLLCRIWDSPPRAKKPATCVNHTLLVRWSSVRGLHGNSDVTHTELAQGQLRGKIPATLLVDDCLSWLRIKELRVDDVGHSTGG